MVWNFSYAANGLMFQKTILKQLNFVISITPEKCASAWVVFSKS